MGRSRRRRAKGWDSGVILLLAAVGAPIALVNWLASLPPDQQVPLVVAIAGVLAAIGYALWKAWAKRQHLKREYQQALLDFRWHEGMSPIEFEHCCADYLQLRGWDASTTKGSGDQGADVIARKAGHLIVLQCKKYGKPVGNKAVQEVIAAKAFQQAAAAIVVSNQSYTSAARDLAEKAGVPLLHFTDLRRLDEILGLPGSDPRNGPSRSGVPGAGRIPKKIEAAAPIESTPKLNWKFPPDTLDTLKSKKQVSIFAECRCGNTIAYDDDLGDDQRLVCNKCGIDHGTFADFEKQARDAVDNLIKGNFWKYEIKSPR